MITYAPLWETMKKKGISQYKLINTYQVSTAQIGRMKKNLYVTTHTIEIFCKILDCQVEDVIKITSD